MNLKKNQEVSLTIEDFTKEGEGLGKYQGFPLFVKDTVIGDEVKVSITKLKKNYGYARLVEIIKPSEDRVTPLCPVARQCGGCKLQQISYDKQLHFKKGLVEGCLTRIGGFEKEDIEQKMEPVYGMEEPWHYRNKAQFPVGYDKEGNLVAGFYAGRTHSIVANTNCAIQAKVTHPIVEKVLAYMRENKISAYDEKNHSGLIRHILTRVGFTTGEIMVCLIVNGTAKQLKNINKLVDKLKEIEGMTSIIVNTNTDKTNKILGLHCETVWGQDYIEDYIGDIKYQIGPLSFYQVNPQQTKVLYSKALEYADLKGQELVWDLYCGIGTISLFLAQKAKQVYGVEIIKEAIDDARRNATLNHMDNVEFFVGKAEEIVPAQYEKTGIHPDVIVVDPPRKGCDATLLNTMLDMAPEHIVYVSCDPATLARDLKILCAEKYTLEKVAVVDQFSHSVHVESVCLLGKRKPDTTVKLSVDMEDCY
ncbi:MAG: 23S rRNA (uracil(1939)-C(5))-methyltransferase RlmD [Anaerobutyricum soehngenii]